MKKVLLFSMVLLLLTSCIFTDGEGEENRAEKAIYPDMILENAHYQIGQPDEEPILMDAKKIIFYSKDNYASLEDFSFYQKDEEGKPKVSGAAQKGSINLSTKDLTLDGQVSFSNDKDGMKISTNALVYSSEKSEIIAEGSVIIESGEGTFAGRNFKGNLAESLYVFEEIEKGELAIE